MKKLIIQIFAVKLLFVLSFLSGLSPKSINASQNSRPTHVVNEVLVKFKKGVQADFIRQGLDYIQGKIVTYLGQEIGPLERVPGILSQRSFPGDPDLFHIKVPEYVGTEQAIAMLRSMPIVEYAEKNIVLYPTSIDDPLYGVQWALDNIDAPEAWTIGTGNSDIIVAVIDCGIDTTHPDLAANLWQNPGEISGNGIDDDHNGYTDDTHGWHWGPQVPPELRNNPDPWFDDSHATEIAGTIGAIWNDIGIRGINQNIRIMNLNVVSWQGTLLSDFINGIDYALDNGASIISCSQGWVPDDQDYEDNHGSFESAIIRARTRGVLFVTACGNYNYFRSAWYNVDESDDHHVYPGCFPEDNIINVMSTDPNDERGELSMYGHESVDIGAPGEQIMTTAKYSGHPNPDDWYKPASGTSQAAPQVAAVAALALGKCPALTYELLTSRIMDYGDSVASLQELCVSGKRLNALGVIYDSSNPTTPTAPSNLSAYQTSWNRVILTWTDNSNNEAGFEVQRYSADKPVFMRYQSCAQNVQTYHDVWAYTHTGSITYTYRVRAGNLGGMSAFSNTADATVPYSVPAAPSDLEADTSIIPNVYLRWADNAINELGFVIQRKKEGGGTWAQIATPIYDDTNYTDHVTLPGTYYYRIKAQNPVGSSSYSNQITVVVENW